MYTTMPKTTGFHHPHRDRPPAISSWLPMLSDNGETTSTDSQPLYRRHHADEAPSAHLIDGVAASFALGDWIRVLPQPSMWPTKTGSVLPLPTITAMIQPARRAHREGYPCWRQSHGPYLGVFIENSITRLSRAEGPAKDVTSCVRRLPGMMCISWSTTGHDEERNGKILSIELRTFSGEWR